MKPRRFARCTSGRWLFTAWPNSLFTPGKGLASVTPRPMIILAASMRDNPIVQAAMDRYQKFMGVEGDNTSKEDVDKYVAKIQENYLASMSNL